MKKPLLILTGIALALVAIFLVASHFYSSAKEAEARKKKSEFESILVRSDSATLGPSNAKVTIVEFFDPECESCRAVFPMVKYLLKEAGGKVRLVLRYMPLHPNSFYAASAIEAAGEQGKFWEMLELLFNKQPEWASHHAPKPELIQVFAKELGLDMKAFQESTQKESHRQKVERDKSDGFQVGVTGTPTFFVNGRRLERLGYDELKALIDDELKR